MRNLKNHGLADLSERRYRIVLEESWHHERPEVRTQDRIWYEQIPCRGEDCFIGVYSLEPLILQLSTSRPKNVRAVWEAIKETPGAKADFHFDGEAVIYFPPDAVHIVAEIAGARKKRRLSPEAKARLIERGKAHRFLPQKHGVETPKTAKI